MTYIQHLFNWTRFKSALWVFIGGVLGFALINLQSVNVNSVTWNDVKGIILTSIILQLTKAWSNYQKNNVPPSPQIYQPAATTPDVLPEVPEDQILSV